MEWFDLVVINLSVVIIERMSLMLLKLVKGMENLLYEICKESMFWFELGRNGKVNMV